MAEYVKIDKQILKDVADAIREHKKTSNLFKPIDFAEIIKKMFVLPSENIQSHINIWKTNAVSTGELPIITNGVAKGALMKIKILSNILAEIEEAEGGE